MAVQPYLEDALYQFLVAQDVVGARVYPNRLKQDGEYPQLSFFRVTSRAREVLDPGPGDYSLVDMQIDVWSLSYGEAKQIQRDLRAALEGYVGFMGTPPLQVAVTRFSARDQYRDEGPSPGVHQVILEITIGCEEP